MAPLSWTALMPRSLSAKGACAHAQSVSVIHLCLSHDVTGRPFPIQVLVPGSGHHSEHHVVG